MKKQMEGEKSNQILKDQSNIEVMELCNSPLPPPKKNPTPPQKTEREREKGKKINLPVRTKKWFYRTQANEAVQFV